MRKLLGALLLTAGWLAVPASAEAQVLVYESPRWTPARVATSYYVAPAYSPRYVAPAYSPSVYSYSEYRDPLGVLPPRRVTTSYYAPAATTYYAPVTTYYAPAPAVVVPRTPVYYRSYYTPVYVDSYWYCP